jgi:hypothetical protein
LLDHTTLTDTLCLAVCCRLRLPSTWRRIPTERRSLQGGELEARARALSYLRLAQWLPKPPAAGRRFDWACLADMPVEAPASLANDLGGDAALASLAWTEVRCCLVDPKHRQGLTVFMRLVTECGIDPLLVDAEQLQQHVGAACRNIQSAKTAKQAHCQLPHIFDALGRHLPSISISSQLDGQLWPRGVRPFALTQLRRVDPVNPVTAAVKQAITAAAASAAAAAAAVGSDQLMAGGSLITSAAAPSASRKVAVSAAVMGVQYLACLGKGIDFYMRLTRPVAGAALTSRSLQPQQPGAPPLAQAPVTSKEQAANALRMALLHLLRLYEAARPLNAAVRLRHADLWTYFGSTQIYLLSLVYLDPAVTAELLTSSRPSKLVTSTWQGKGKQQSLLRQRHALPAAYNVMDLIECYVIVCRLLIELADGVLPGAAGRVADEQRSSLPLQQDLQSEEEEEEGDDDEQQSAADAAQLLEQLAAFVDAPTATAAMPTGVTYEQQQQQPQQQQQQQPAASPAHLEALVFGPRFCASTASRGTHCPALAHCGLYTTRRAAAQEMVHHHVPPAIIRILMGHSFNR